ncbi:MAG: ABC transporter permease [Ruminococcaceae bacterium]|nr:ABC transporter permease [Oscillospiraceae bacterium]
MVSLSYILQRSIVQSAPLLLGSTGEILTEKAGNLNLGTAGTMYVGAISGVIGAFLYEQSIPDGGTLNPFIAVIIPILCCCVGSFVMGLIYSFLTITLRANQNVTGLALTTFGTGLANFFGTAIVKIVDSDVPAISFNKTSAIYKAYLPIADDLGWFGRIFLSHGFLLYVAIIIAVLAAFFLKRTSAGLNLRAIGENPATADAAGINVNRYKYVATCVGSVISGLGGLYYIMEIGSWSINAIGDLGWLAIALVIFALWKPNIGILGSIVFGGLYIADTFTSGLPADLVRMLPYLVTIVVLIITSTRRKKEHQPPAHLGLAYFREER